MMLHEDNTNKHGRKCKEKYIREGPYSVIWTRFRYEEFDLGQKNTICKKSDTNGSEHNTSQTPVTFLLSTQE